MSSDEDQPVVESLYVGFDADMRLVITIEHVDYDEPEDSCSVSAVIDKEGAFELSKKLSVSMSQLLDVIKESMVEYTKIPNADFRQVQECFKDITDCLVNEKCPYRIERKYGNMAISVVECCRKVYPEHRGLGIFKCKPCVFEERKGCDDRDSKCCLSPLLFAAS